MALLFIAVLVILGTCSSVFLLLFQSLYLIRKESTLIGSGLLTIGWGIPLSIVFFLIFLYARVEKPLLFCLMIINQILFVFVLQKIWKEKVFSKSVEGSVWNRIIGTSYFIVAAIYFFFSYSWGLPVSWYYFTH